MSHKGRVLLYNASNIDSLTWPTTEDGHYAQRYLYPFIKHGPQTYIKNVHTGLQLVRIDNIILPLTLTRYHPENSYVCSPYNHYFAYGREEFDKLDNPVVAAGLRGLLAPLLWLYRRSTFDRVLFVNNWLLSTNLYPALQPEQIETLSAFLIARFPHVPVVFRSVDTLGNAQLFQTLSALGYRMVFSRQVYYQKVQDPALWRKKQVKIDLNVHRRSPYHLLDHHQLSPADIPRLAHLYRLLYLEKYSYFNPQFTRQFFELALAKRLLTFKAFQHEGRIDAVMGYFSRNGIMTQPIFGYDTHLPQTLALYRLLSLQVMLEGRANGCLINSSAGVGAFKRLRGGVPALEYNAVYNRHLPPGKRYLWTWLKLMLDYVAVPVIQKFGF